MEARYVYITQTGSRSGPFTSAELQQLAEVGGVELSGSIEDESTGARWAVAAIPWLRDAVGRARQRSAPPPPSGPTSAFSAGDSGTPVPGSGLETPPASGPAEPRPEPAQPEPVQPADERRAPPTYMTPPPDGASATYGVSPLCKRSSFILLALLPAIVGVFGIHNIVAGYTARGVVQLVLSLLVIGGVIGIAITGPCCCFGVPVYLVLWVWVIIEAVTITRDSTGRVMQ
jgi:hypothetical protein